MVRAFYPIKMNIKTPGRYPANSLPGAPFLLSRGAQK